MDVYLTEEELLRERNLFAPHETSYVPLEGTYAPLEGRTDDIRSFTEQVSMNDDTLKPPSSC